jgi:hypothetical protein
MKNYTLVQYGSLNLTSRSVVVNASPLERGNFNNIQRLANARSAGSSPVNKVVAEKNVNLAGTLFATTTETLTEVVNRVNRCLAEDSRYLRFIRRWEGILEPTDTQVYYLAGDGSSYEYVTENTWFNSAISISSVVVGSGDYTSFYTTLDNGIDLEDYDQSGNFEIYFYIPAAKYVTSVGFRVGSDSSSYVDSGNITLQFDGTAIKDGWNCFSVRWADMTDTGIVDPEQMGKYVYGIINYTSSQANSTILFGGLTWIDDTITRNYRAMVSSFVPEELHHAITVTNFELEMLCYEGIAESTSRDSLLTTSVSTNPYSATVTYEGSYTPEPLIEIRLNNVTNLDTITLQNETTGDVVTLDETWAVDDFIEIDLDEKEVRRNNTSIAYTSVLPRFEVGRNDIVITQTSSSQNTVSQTTNNANLIGEI